MENQNEKRIQDFTDLEVWRETHQFILKIYRITKDFPKGELFGIVSQIRRASVSISANISEGFGRWYFKDKMRFYYQARGSASEVYNLLIICRDLNYFDQETYDDFDTRIQRIRRMLNGLINSINPKCQ